MEEGGGVRGQEAAVWGLGLVRDDTATRELMLLAWSQPMQNGSMYRSPRTAGIQVF